jgi:hypothetical protein
MNSHEEYESYCIKFHAERIKTAHDTWRKMLIAVNGQQQLTLDGEELKIASDAMQSYLKQTT